mgnify:FL=1
MPFYLYNSDRKGKKLVMVMPEFKHKHHFGAKDYRDFTLINDKSSKYYIADVAEREKVKKAYQTRHKGDKIDDVHSPGALSWYILWSGKTIAEGIKNYEKRFNVKVVNRT